MSGATAHTTRHSSESARGPARPSLRHSSTAWRARRVLELSRLHPQPRGPVEEEALAGVGMTGSEVENTRAGALRTAWRLMQLVAAIVRFLIASAGDVVLAGVLTVFRRRNREGLRLRLPGRRARRLRQALQGLGGTFIKIGQQLAIRSDLLPQVYCRELEHLLDNADSIPEQYVREVLERQGGRPLEQLFRSPFDFTPVGKASIACVYRAQLASGAVVAVKVRRPGIVALFKADLAALGWVARAAEFLTLLRPGISRTFRSELAAMLYEELDFRIESRYQELFRRYFKRRPELRITAPRLHFELCGHDVLVSEFVSGVWMKELMAGVESGDASYLERLRGFGIDPAAIAKRLIRGSHYGFFECPFFHGDPHPGNILIQPDNQIVMVDFGACGVFAQRERDQLAQLHYFQSREDVGGMVQCVIGLMEPLPPIDVDAFRRALEDAWWKGFYGVKSRHAAWWERTSFRLWSALLRLVREHGIPMPLNVLRMIRATLLYDTVAARIYARIDVFREYRKYHEQYARRVRRRIQRAVVRQLFCGPDLANYVRVERLWHVGQLLLNRVQLFLQSPTPSFAVLVSKGFELLAIGTRWLLTSACVTLLVAFASTWTAHEGPLQERLLSGTTGGILLLLLLLTAFKYLRQASFRLNDKDPA